METIAKIDNKKLCLDEKNIQQNSKSEKKFHQTRSYTNKNHLNSMENLQNKANFNYNFPNTKFDMNLNFQNLYDSKSHLKFHSTTTQNQKSRQITPK